VLEDDSAVVAVGAAAGLKCPETSPRRNPPPIPGWRPVGEIADQQIYLVDQDTARTPGFGINASDLPAGSELEPVSVEAFPGIDTNELFRRLLTGPDEAARAVASALAPTARDQLPSDIWKRATVLNPAITASVAAPVAPTT
jgi:hypothetical protein